MNFFTSEAGESAFIMAVTTAIPVQPAFITRDVFSGLIPPIAIIGNDEAFERMETISSPKGSLMSFLVSVGNTRFAAR